MRRTQINTNQQQIQKTKMANKNKKETRETNQKTNANHTKHN